MSIDVTALAPAQLETAPAGEKSSLAEDLLRGVPAIAAFTGEPVRRQRHLIAAHGFPHFKRGDIIYSRKSWALAYYDAPTPEQGA